MERLPSLTAVRYFEVAARLHNFTAAAAELNVTQGAVSRMVQTLEQQLGTRLFERNGRWITLTPAGRTYYHKVSESLHQIAAAGQQLLKLVADETLTLIVNNGFAALWLVPHLADFNRRHPEIQVDVLTGEGVEREHASRAQAMIQFGLPPWPGQESTRLPVGPMLTVVCTPALRETFKAESPADLSALPLLAFTSGKKDPWQQYFAHFGLPRPDLGKAPRFHQLMMLREAALSGLGLAIVPQFLFAQDMLAGRLVQVIDQTCRSDLGYYLTHRKGADDDPKVKAFKKWLLSKTRDVLPAERQD